MLESVGEAATRTLLLASAVQCIFWLLRVRRPQLMLAAWTVVLVASIAMPLLQQVTPLRVPLGPALPKPLLDSASDLLQGPLLLIPLERAGSKPPMRLTPASWLAAVYLVVSAGILLRVVLGVGLSFRLLFQAIPIRSGWAQGTRVRISRDVAGPVTIANVILLPTDALDWSVEIRQAVLAHERAHVARWDFAMLVASQINRGLFWFSPLSWWLHRRLVTLTELASDDQAMASLSDRLRYAEILLEMGRRSVPVSQGPAMARPTTLAHRIDRILLDQVPTHPVDKVWRISLAAGVAGLSLATASMTSLSVPQPFMESLSGQWDFHDEYALHRADSGDAVEQGTTVPQSQAEEAASTPNLPQSRTRTVAEAQSDKVPASFPSVSVATVAPQPASKTLHQENRRTPHAMPRGTAFPSSSHAMARAAQGIAGREKENDEIGQQELSNKEMASHSVRGTDTLTATNSPADDKVPLPLSHPVAFESLISALPRDFQGIMGSICTGSIEVGPNVQSSPDKQPYVVAGQLVSARAQFHFKTDGTPWVRFDAFGQRSLDLPLQFTRNGMTWTGQYGVAYTVQASGGSRLRGLAGFFRNDSARLDFTCVKTTLVIL